MDCGLLLTLLYNDQFTQGSSASVRLYFKVQNPCV